MRDNPYRVEIVGTWLMAGIVLPLETWRRWGELSSPAALDDFTVFAAALVVVVQLARKRTAAPAWWMFVCGGAWFMMLLSVYGSLYFAGQGDPSGMPVALVFGFKATMFGLISVASWRAQRRLQRSDPYT